MDGFCAACETPLGPLTLWVTADGNLHRIELPREQAAPVRQPSADGDGPGMPPAAAATLAATRLQLQQYFAGQRLQFALPLAPQGTPFQQAAWAILRTIPFGTTRSYGAQAAQLGRPQAVRAVGAANGKNPLPIVVPCHRVLGKNGALVGFAGGLATKQWLLQHERSVLALQPPAATTALVAAAQPR
jgi:methylated-DNA-[protein]-cysteine S-methyltransferase